MYKINYKVDLNIKRINDLMSECQCTKSLARSAEIV